jgi:methylornithine synthase
MKQNAFFLPTILCKAVEGRSLVKDEITFLLSLRKKDDIDLLQRSARLVRSKYFGNKVFLYGFLYFSTYCKNDCNFCQFRCSNKELLRYRKSDVEIVELAKNLRDSGVHLIDLTMGEDPTMFHPDFGLKRLMRLVQTVRSETGLPVMLSPGAAPVSAIVEMAGTGTEWFACYQETHSRALFNTLRKGQSYDRRMESKLQAQKHGMLIEEGILTGVGESVDDIAHSIIEMRSMKADQVRAMTFVPQVGTPMASVSSSDGQLEQIIISVLRLVLPDALIPASLDIDGLNGLQKRILAGANVVTSIVPAGRGLSGVANSSLDIEESRRSVESIRTVLQFCGMEAATSRDYRKWLDARLQGADNPLQKGGTSVNCRYWS